MKNKPINLNPDYKFSFNNLLSNQDSEFKGNTENYRSGLGSSFSNFLPTSEIVDEKEKLVIGYKPSQDRLWNDNMATYKNIPTNTYEEKISAVLTPRSFENYKNLKDYWKLLRLEKVGKIPQEEVKEEFSFEEKKIIYEFVGEFLSSYFHAGQYGWEDRLKLKESWGSKFKEKFEVFKRLNIELPKGFGSLEIENEFSEKLYSQVAEKLNITYKQLCQIATLESLETIQRKINNSLVIFDKIKISIDERNEVFKFKVIDEFQHIIEIKDIINNKVKTFHIQLPQELFEKLLYENINVGTEIHLSTTNELVLIKHINDTPIYKVYENGLYLNIDREALSLADLITHDQSTQVTPQEIDMILTGEVSELFY
jgi:hypothetical protein